MADPTEGTSVPSRDLSVEVLVAGVLFLASAGVTGLSMRSTQDPPTALVLLGWPVMAMVGVVQLDQRPGSGVGRTNAALGLLPTLVVAYSLVRFHTAIDSADLARSAGNLSAVLAVAVAVTLPWAFLRPAHARAATAFAGAAAAGSLLVVAASSGALGARVAALGWVLSGIGSLGVWALVAWSTKAADRTTRRRVTWLFIVLGTAGGVAAAGWAARSGNLGYYATCAAMMTGILAVAALWQRADFRPFVEHLVDVSLALATVVTAAVVAGLVLLGSHVAHRPSSQATTLFTALLTLAMATPGALWVRRSLLARRYGTGLISPADVAVITADLHAQTEPRDLLDKAARMVAAASGSADARIVLGEEAPSVPAHWTAHPLDVGGDRVGFLAVESGDPEGPEPRQQKVVAQLLPTVALVARAVGLAVEAEHARRDVARERDAERRRVLGDLHDGLGPALAGMSMRVQASLRTTTAPEYAAPLRDLAEGLAACRADLRRIVAGITPSTLADGDLDAALAGLVGSFRGATDHPKVGLTVALSEPVAPEVQVAVYRSVAEGITNGLRHASADRIEVTVRTRDHRVLVDITDDGVGGPVVPGVGLSSLARRAEGMGGQMRICPAGPGTTLHLELPTEVAS